MTALELETGVREELGGLSLFSLGVYDGWLQSVVLKNKQTPPRPVVDELARLLMLKMPASWRDTPVVWVPGRALGEIHLVESLALALNRLGHPLYARPLLRRRLGWRKPQKALNEEARRARQAQGLYATIGRARSTIDGANVILLDDVVTTGTTVVGCARLIEERLGLKVQGALSVAFTPPKA